MKEMEKVWYYEKWVGRHASFPPRRSVNRQTFFDRQMFKQKDRPLHLEFGQKDIQNATNYNTY